MRPGPSPRLRGLIADEDGPTSAEYAVILALILGSVITIVAGVGGSAQSWWRNNVDRITAAIDS